MASIIKGLNIKCAGATGRIMKAMSIFGTVQFIQMFCSVVRTKLVAVWIGPAGVGLIAIYNTLMELFSNFTQLNLRQSSVRDLSQAVGNSEEFASLAAAVRKLAFCLGIAGMILMIASSPLLGHYTFGDKGHSLPFIILSPMLLLSALASGDWAIMQSSGKLKNLAQSNLFAAVTATVIAIPLFYFFRIKAIVPVLVIYAACNCLYAYIFSRHFVVPRISLRQTWQQSRGMLSFGVYLTFSACFTLFSYYAFISVLNVKYSESIVGIFQSGYTIVNSYVGLIFTAISMEYYPRLSSMIFYKRRTETVVNHEIKIVLLTLLPVTVAFICCRELMVRLLYSSEFSAVIPYISVAILGVSFRAVSWCLAFTILARGDGGIYFITELISAFLYFFISCISYVVWGFTGLGTGYVVWYMLYTISTWLVYSRNYHYKLHPCIIALTFAVPSVGIICLVIDYFLGPWFCGLIMFPVVACIIWAIRKR